MKSNKPSGCGPFITGRGTYQAAKFEEDADKVVEYYRNQGYVMARVGQPELQYVEDSTDRRTRYVELRVPVDRGRALQGGRLHLRRQHGRQDRGLQGVFKVKPGTYYSEKKIRKALDKAREVYGSLGYFEFTAYPDIKPREPASPEEQALAPTAPGPPVIDVTMRVQEGKQYFVNRITFVGQHHHARQRHPARDPPVRRRRVQHRGAEVQRQAAEPARLLQAARGRQQGH